MLSYAASYYTDMKVSALNNQTNKHISQNQKQPVKKPVHSSHRHSGKLFYITVNKLSLAFAESIHLSDEK